MQLTVDASFRAATFSISARSCRAQEEDLKEEREVYYTLHNLHNIKLLIFLLQQELDQMSAECLKIQSQTGECLLHIPEL